MDGICVRLLLLFFLINETISSDEIITVEGDILTYADSYNDGITLSFALTSERSRWPNAVVKYTLDSDFTQNEKDEILEAMAEIQRNTCINFVKLSSTTEESSYVKIIKSSNEQCATFAGRTGLAQDFSIDTSQCLSRGKLLHLLMHVLGFLHEQNRADRDDYVQIKYENLIAKADGYFRKQERNELIDFGTHYDYASIMHFGKDAYSKNGEETIIPRKRGANKMGKWKELSKADIKRINGLYKCDQRKGTSPDGSFADPTDTKTIVKEALEQLLAGFNPSKTSIVAGRPTLVEQSTTTTTTTTTAPPPQSKLVKIREAMKQGQIFIKAVTLAGWLVAEYDISTGSPIWKGVPKDVAMEGEYQTMDYLGRDKGNKRIEGKSDGCEKTSFTGDVQATAHRNSFYTEKDFEEIAAAGLNTVKIPIGYWIVGFDNSGGGDTTGWKVYTPNGLNYLDMAIRTWAPKHNLMVLISMQAAKGSQNGEAHSSPQSSGITYWGDYPENVNNTLNTIQWLVNRYKDEETFLGVGLLNEPSDQNIFTLKQYYYDSYGRIRTDLKSECQLIVSPLVDQQNRQDGQWEQFMLWPSWFGVRHEWHPAFATNASSVKELMKAASSYRKQINSWTGNWLFIGSWNLKTSFDMSKSALAKYADVLLHTFAPAKGWCFSAWKTYREDGTEVNVNSMKSLIKSGVIKLK